MKCKENLGFLCDRRIPLKLKGKFYTTVIRPALTYGTQCWTMNESYKNKMTATEMKMLRQSLLARIKSVLIRGSLKIKNSIVVQIEKNRLSWYCHVQRRPETNPVREAIEVRVE